jgi:hypothetical protein
VTRVSLTMPGPLRLLVVALLAAVVSVPAATAADPPALPARSQLVADRANFLKLAEQGLVQTKKLWWNAELGWYDDRLNDQDHLPLATLWSAYPLFEATNAVAIAHPTKANKARVNSFAAHAVKYWDPNIVGHGGFSYYYTSKGGWNAYFDDNGWWGLAFLDAYRATGNKQWLTQATRALNFINTYGWDPASGGVWWDTEHHHKTSEPLAAGALIGAILYRYTHKPAYLAIAKKFISWGNRRSWNAKAKLYGRSDTDKTVMDYVEGMMVAAHEELCISTKVKSWCTKARKLANASLNAFPIDADWAPETDVVYMRWMLDLYDHDHNARWYALVYRNAKRAVANARDEQGLWSKRWDGGWTQPGMLRTQAGTLALLAWMSTSRPPTVLTWR